MTYKKCYYNAVVPVVVSLTHLVNNNSPPYPRPGLSSTSSSSCCHCCHYLHPPPISLIPLHIPTEIILAVTVQGNMMPQTHLVATVIASSHHYCCDPPLPLRTSLPPTSTNLDGSDTSSTGRPITSVIAVILGHCVCCLIDNIAVVDNARMWLQSHP